MIYNKPIYKLLDWIPKHKIIWLELSENPNAIDLLEQNIDKINWKRLSQNENAIDLLEKNKDKINWKFLCLNPNATHLIEKNLDKLYIHNWFYVLMF